MLLFSSKMAPRNIVLQLVWWLPVALGTLNNLFRGPDITLVYVANKKIDGECSSLSADALFDTGFLPVSLQLELLGGLSTLLAANARFNWRNVSEVQGALFSRVGVIPSDLLEDYIAFLGSWVVVPENVHSFLLWYNQQAASSDVETIRLYLQQQFKTDISTNRIFAWYAVAVLAEIGHPIDFLLTDVSKGVARLAPVSVAKMFAVMEEMIKKEFLPPAREPMSSHSFGIAISDKVLRDPVNYHIWQSPAVAFPQLADVLECFLYYFDLVFTRRYDDLLSVFQVQYPGGNEDILRYVIEWVEEHRSVSNHLSDYLMFYNQNRFMPQMSVAEFLAVYRTRGATAPDPEAITAWYHTMVLPNAGRIPSEIFAVSEGVRVSHPPAVLRQMLQSELILLIDRPDNQSQFCVLRPTTLDPNAVPSSDESQWTDELIDFFETSQSWNLDEPTPRSFPIVLLRRIIISQPVVTRMIDLHKADNVQTTILVDADLISRWLEETGNILDQSVSDIAQIYRVLFVDRPVGVVFSVERDLRVASNVDGQPTFRLTRRFLTRIFELEIDRHLHLLQAQQQPDPDIVLM